MSCWRFNRMALLQLITVILLMVPFVVLGVYVWTKHQLVLKQLHDLEPRYARLQGVLAHQADLQRSVVRVNGELARLAYSPIQDASKTANEAQQRIRSVLVDSKLDVISIQVLPPKQEVGFDRIQISVRAEGDLVGFHAALAKLGTLSPLILVDNLALQTIGAARPSSVQRLSAQMILTVFRAQS